MEGNTVVDVKKKKKNEKPAVEFNSESCMFFYYVYIYNYILK
jgi:hypothetical protein